MQHNLKYLLSIYDSYAELPNLEDDSVHIPFSRTELEHMFMINTLKGKETYLTIIRKTKYVGGWELTIQSI